MDLDKEFPLRFLINLGRREDRRIASEEMLASHGVSAERLPAIDQRWIKRERGFETVGRYALALTQRLALRRAKRMRAAAVLLFEDDIALHPRFAEMVHDINLPDDWGLFYFGCAHTSRPTPAGTGIVRCRFALDTHAIAIRAPYYDMVMSALKGAPGQGAGKVCASDLLIAALHEKIPAYAAFPNLAWQEASRSDLLDLYCTNYEPTGAQWHSQQATAGLAAELRGARPYQPVLARPFAAPPEHQQAFRPAFLALTMGDHYLPSIWEDYLRDVRERVSVYCHSKQRCEVTSGFLRDAIIADFHETRWGDISLVRATLSLLKAALEDRRNSHFILLSESCVPIKPFSHLEKLLTIDSRSVIGHESYREVLARQPRKAARFDAFPRIPKECIHFHPQWMMLSREAAELVTEDDFTGEFEGMFAPDECYFATVLSMKGYPFEERVRRADSTWARWEEEAMHPDEFERVDENFAAELLVSPFAFARKFMPGSDIGRYKLHLAESAGSGVKPKPEVWTGPTWRGDGSGSSPKPPASTLVPSTSAAMAPSVQRFRPPSSASPRLLYFSPIGPTSDKLLPDTLARFRGVGSDCLLVKYADCEAGEQPHVRVVKDRGAKWKLALRHLGPEVVRDFDYVFVWDDDIGIGDFNPVRFVRIMESNRLEMAQPSLRSPHPICYAITRQQPCPAPSGDYHRVGRLTNFVEIMVPVFTRKAWLEIHSYLSEDLAQGWGLDYVQVGNKGIIDCMHVVHTRRCNDHGDEAQEELDRFLDSQGLFYFPHQAMGHLLELPTPP